MTPAENLSLRNAKRFDYTEWRQSFVDDIQTFDNLDRLLLEVKEKSAMTVPSDSALQQRPGDFPVEKINQRSGEKSGNDSPKANHSGGSEA